MDSLTFANVVVQPVYNATSDDVSAATFVSAAGTTDDTSAPSDQQVSLATSAFDPYNSIFSAPILSLGGDDEFGPANVFSQTQTTLAYSSQNNAVGTTLTTGDNSDTANAALFGQYLASNLAPSSTGSIDGTAINGMLAFASNTASDAGANSDAANPATTPASMANTNNSSASPVMLSATAEQAPAEIISGSEMDYSMSDSAFAVATTAAMPDPAASSGGTAFAVITPTTSDAAPPASGDGFVAGDLVATNGSTTGSITTPDTGGAGLTSEASNAAAAPQNTWQQNVALMGNYMASTFPLPAAADGFANSATSSAPSTQDTLAAQMGANHQNST